MGTGKLENWEDIQELVAMSLGTDKGSCFWDKDFGSDIWLLQKEKVTATTIGNLRQMILDCTAWLIEDGLAKKIECTAEQTGRNSIAYCVTVYRPIGETIEIKEDWNV